MWACCVEVGQGCTCGHKVQWGHLCSCSGGYLCSKQPRRSIVHSGTDGPQGIQPPAAYRLDSPGLEPHAMMKLLDIILLTLRNV